MKKLWKNKKGFTLVEIIVVLVILAILLAAVTPTMINFINDSRGKAMTAEANSAKMAAQMVWLELTTAGTTATGSSILSNPKYTSLTAELTTLGGSVSNLDFTTNGQVRKLTYSRGGYYVNINSDGTVTTGKGTAPVPS